MTRSVDFTNENVKLSGSGTFAEAYWYWIAPAALLGFILIFNVFLLSLSPSSTLMEKFKPMKVMQLMN
ncbi:putative plant PDR ABC transporter associated [Helianthus annuus]|nr:putative plant PDR ABC transporter associated [Helianthus annuus]